MDDGSEEEPLDWWHCTSSLSFVDTSFFELRRLAHPFDPFSSKSLHIRLWEPYSVRPALLNHTKSASYFLRFYMFPSHRSHLIHVHHPWPVPGCHAILILSAITNSLFTSLQASITSCFSLLIAIF